METVDKAMYVLTAIASIFLLLGIVAISGEVYFNHIACKEMYPNRYEYCMVMKKNKIDLEHIKGE